MTDKKKLTNTQLQRRIANAVVFVPKDKDYEGIFFSDKGLRLEITSDCAVISTAFHSHVFRSITSGGVSRPYIYTKRFVEIAKSHLEEIEVKDKEGGNFYSYQALFNTLKEKGENNNEYLVACLVDYWFTAIFTNLYDIQENPAGSFITFLNYVCHLAKAEVVLDEKAQGLTSKQFVLQFIDKVKAITDGIPDYVVFEAKTDEQIAEENIMAMQEQEADEILKGQDLTDGSQD